ncbi:hypothetical protein GCM10020256_02870 [Streptomyces thermocoprophilus]
MVRPAAVAPRRTAEKPGHPTDGDRTPDTPAQMSKQSWWAVLKRTVREFEKDELTDRAAALTYHGVLSLFPALLVPVSLPGIAGRPATDRGNTAVLLGLGFDAEPARQRAIAGGMPAHEEPYLPPRGTPRLGRGGPARHERLKPLRRLSASARSGRSSSDGSRRLSPPARCARGR